MDWEGRKREEAELLQDPCNHPCNAPRKVSEAKSYISQCPCFFCGSFHDSNSVFSYLSAHASKRRAVNRLEKLCTLQSLQFVIALVCLCLEINFTKQTSACFVCLCLLLPWHAFSPTESACSKLMHLHSYR